MRFTKKQNDIVSEKAGTINFYSDAIMKYPDHWTKSEYEKYLSYMESSIKLIREEINKVI